MAAWLYFFYALLFCLLLGVVYALLKVFFINGVPCSSRERLDGKTVIITGGNCGIGKETAVDLAQRGGRIILACRDLSTGSSAVREIKKRSGSENIVLKKLDLASCKSVRDFASQILQEEDQVNILICNAGLMFPPFQLTEDGFELTFGVNHLGHFLLTNLLLEQIKESTPSRIIVVSSLAHVTGYLDFGDMMWRKRYNPYLAYCRSKLANVMFARELARRLSDAPGVTVCALHPGTVNTGLYRYFLSGWMALLRPLAHIAMLLLTKTPLQGAQTTIHCAVAKEVEGISGKYWVHCAIQEPARKAKDNDNCRKLWDYSSKLVQITE